MLIEQGKSVSKNVEKYIFFYLFINSFFTKLRPKQYEKVF